MRRPKDWDVWTGRAELTEIAAVLHQIALGSMDGTVEPMTVRYRMAVEWALKHWEPSSSQYDKAVKLMLQAALKEWRYFERRIRRNRQIQRKKAQ